ncbi:adhesion G-protein coupled receptor G4-like [Patiria miniata]|uniref:Uncharacterized protein n=1 Tax=Patiria miniata TaxID=46514 RepID=A0A914A6Z1_PATMI|nr:adhesion G-protein coupled receptor G4-like [Patiria miniata]
MTQQVIPTGESMFRNWTRLGFLPFLSLLLVASLVGIHCQDVCQDGTGPNGNGTLCDCQPMTPGATVLNVDCTGRALTEIPVFPTNTGVLVLTNNNIQVIQVRDFKRLDTLQKLQLTGNPLVCDCALTDFKSWVINLQSASSTAQLVEGAVCGDATHGGTNVVDAFFCFDNLLCYQSCTNVVDGSACSSQLCFPSNGNACKNDLSYAADGSVLMTKSCVFIADCRQAASTVNEAVCRQTDGATMRCVYCCQGDNCNEELNTINDTYVFPFRRPLAATTAAPTPTETSHFTTDFQLTSYLASTPEKPATTSETQTTSGRGATQTLTTEMTRTPLLETISLRTDGTVQSSSSFSTSESSYQSSSQSSVSFRETVPTRTGSTVQTLPPSSTSELSYTGTGSQTAETFTEIAPTRTDSLVQTSESFSTSESSYQSAGFQTSVSSQETIPTSESISTSESPYTGTGYPTSPFSETNHMPTFTDSMVQTSNSFSTTESSHTGTGSQTTGAFSKTVPTRTDSMVQTSHSSSTSQSSYTGTGSQTSVPSIKRESSNTQSMIHTSKRHRSQTSQYIHFAFSDSGSQSTGYFSASQTRQTDSVQTSRTPYRGTSERPQETKATTTPSLSTTRPTTERDATSPCDQVPPNRWCLIETTEGEWGSITWPAVIANRTAVVPCPYKTLVDPEASRRARRTCLWDATSKKAFWGKPDMSECPTASGVLEELAKIEITESNALAVSSQLTIVTSYPETLTADDVTSAVDALKRLLDALIRYPEKGQEIFKDAMATAGQMTSVKFEELVEGQKINRTTSRLLQLIDDFAIHVPFLNASKLTWESRAIDVITLDVADRHINDLLFGGSMGVDDVKPFVVLNGSSPENLTDIVGSVKLPSSLLNKLGDQLSRTQFLLYQSTTYFNVITSSVAKPYGDLTPPTGGAVTVLSSAVISASVGNLSIADLQEPVLIRLQKSQTANATNPQCVFWDTEANDKQGGWSAKGCAVNFELSDSTTVVCECNHLTNFAMLMDVYNMGELDPVHSKILAIISYIGCSLSILALTLAIITLGCCKEDPKYRVTGSGSLNTGNNGKARADRHTGILVHLSVGLILADASFLLNTVAVELEFGRDACLGTAVATHYSLLAAMAWMALEAFNMYLALVLVFDKYYSRFMLKMCLFGWGAPLIVVAITFSINFPNNYGLINGICWLARIPFLASFLAPVCAVLLFNMVVFVAVTWQLCKMRRRNISQSRRKFDLAAQFKASASITFLFGLTWAFALFGIGEARLAFSYLFAIFNSAQGFNIFVFQCLLKPSIRKRWLKWLRQEHEEIHGSSKSSGGKDSKNVEMFKVTGSAQSSGQPTGRL